MNIKTKYDIGDEVWMARITGSQLQIRKDRVHQILINNGKRLEYNLYNTGWLYESSMYPDEAIAKREGGKLLADWLKQELERHGIAS